MKKLPDDLQVEFLVSFVEQTVRTIVEHTDEASVEYTLMPGRIVMTVKTAPSDVGLVLGTEGATANAIRRLLWTACKKTNLRADIDVFLGSKR